MLMVFDDVVGSNVAPVRDELDEHLGGRMRVMMIDAAAEYLLCMIARPDIDTYLPRDKTMVVAVPEVGIKKLLTETLIRASFDGVANKLVMYEGRMIAVCDAIQLFFRHRTQLEEVRGRT